MVKWVLADDFGTKETRRKALTTLGYNYDAVQAAVTAKLQGSQKKEDTNSPRIRMYAPRFWENDPDFFGDETIFIEGKKGTVFDTGMKGSLAVSKLKALGLDEITIIITHPHGDHTGNVKTMVDSLPVKHVYLKKKGVPVTWLKMGDSFTVGSLRIQCLFQADADKLKEKDGHHFINNMSMVYKVTAGMWRILIGGDLSAEGILQMMASGVDFSCDVFKFFWSRGHLLRLLRACSSHLRSMSTKRVKATAAQAHITCSVISVLSSPALLRMEKLMLTSRGLPQS